MLAAMRRQSLQSNPFAEPRDSSRQRTLAHARPTQPARTAVEQAAQDIASWSAGALDRDMAIASLEAVTTLLK
jgi:hypothetical protein